MTSFTHRRSTHYVVTIAITIAVVLGVGAAFALYQNLYRATPAQHFESDEDHFLFGSVGTEADDGLPYWVWLVLPRIFPDLLPGAGGYSSLGIIAKPGAEMPIGFSKVKIGYERVGVNCAMCHAGSVRATSDAIPTILPAAPAHQAAAQRYLRFLTDAAADPRFTSTTILTEISKNYRLPLIQREIYRFIVIPRTRRALLRLREQGGWMAKHAEWGRGRVDRLNPIKFRRLDQPVDDTIATVDTMPVWNLKAHGPAYFWDGMNTDLREVVLSSAVADGASTTWLDRDFGRWEASDARETSSLRRVMNYLSAVPPPTFPLTIDPALATIGDGVFRTECASCHATGGQRAGQVIPASEVGTDRHRLDAWTTNAASAYNALGAGHEWKFSTFRTTNGYVAAPLDGLWARGPYLHNGSVPTVADLLEPAAARPTRFWRGYDVIDPERVGFISTTPEAERAGTAFDTSQPGNSNAGHAYGTTLAPELKRALLEYLKTL